MENCGRRIEQIHGQGIEYADMCYANPSFALVLHHVFSTDSAQTK